MKFLNYKLSIICLFSIESFLACDSKQWSLEPLTDRQSSSTLDQDLLDEQQKRREELHAFEESTFILEYQQEVAPGKFKIHRVKSAVEEIKDIKQKACLLGNYCKNLQNDYEIFKTEILQKLLEKEKAHQDKLLAELKISEERVRNLTEE